MEHTKKNIYEDDYDDTKDYKQLESLEEIRRAVKIPNRVERHRLESDVINSYMQCGTLAGTYNILKGKHPKLKFSQTEVKDVLVKYQDALIYASEMEDKKIYHRIIKAKENLTNELLQLAITGKNLAHKYDAQDDHAGAIQALKAGADIFMKVAKLEGHVEESKAPVVTVNMQMDKIVQEISTDDSKFSAAVMNVLNDKVKKDESPVLDAEFTEK